ncbi:MAG TPA: chloride channel protein [Hyphomicrobiales bacterium]|nr:chloride channel protein [Hyphomicrobiales bacterium]
MSQTSSRAAPPAARPHQSSSAKLGDFTANPRILVLIAMAIVVGAGGTASAWVLVKLIALVTNLTWFGRFSTASVFLSSAHPNWWMVLAPAVGGLAIGLMARFGSEKIRGHGIPEAIEAILIGGSRMEPKVAALKPLSSAISIGTGGPFGAEGPIIMTGGAIGSLFAQFFRMSAAERKTLLVAGAAAGMTAIFGTPIAAVMLAVELLLFEWKPRSFIPVAAAAVVAAAMRPLLIGSGPLFAFAFVPHLPWWSWPLYVGVGIVAGLQSGLLTTLLYGCEDLFSHIRLHWMWWPAIGGLAVGVGGLFDPGALGVGYDQIAALLSGHIAGQAAVTLLLVKAAIWLVALASGTSGGVLAPLLILGGALGSLEGLWLPGEVGFWALLGMAGMIGGTMRAPLTAALFAVELTGNIAILPALLATTSAAFAVTVLLLKRSILTEKIARRGLHLTREYSVDPFEIMRARDVMVPLAEMQTLPARMPIDEAVAFFTGSEPRYKSYPVVDRAGRVVGMAARSHILRWMVEGSHNGQTLQDAVSDASLVVAHPDDILAHIADLMVDADVGRVPIVERGTSRLAGLVARKDLLRIRAHTGSQERERSAYFGRSPKSRPRRLGPPRSPRHAAAE